MTDIFSKIAKDDQVKKQLRNNRAKSPVIGAAVRVGAWDKIAEKIANKNESVAAKMKAKVLAELAENKKNTVKQTVVPAIKKTVIPAKKVETKIEMVIEPTPIVVETEEVIEAAKPEGLITQLKDAGAEVEIKSATQSTDAPEEEEVQTAAIREGGRTVGAGQVTEIVE